MSTDRLACTHCRHRKVRCSRTIPVCERCRLYHLECSYPKRRARRTRSKTELPISSKSAFPENFGPVDEQVTARNTPQAQTTAHHNAARHSSRPSSASPALNLGVDVDQVDPQFLSNRNEGTPLDVTSILSCAVDKVQQVRKKHRFGMKALILESASIPSDVAKRLIHHYFTNINGKLLPALVDRKLIDVMPDLINMNHVHFDACMLMIYYCILWQGLFFHKGNTSNGIDSHYARQVFICCKRTIPIWQQEATGTVTDFIAAMYMTQTATENFDFSLSWEMHRLACEYAQTLRMHNLDSLDHPASHLSMSDHDRMGMWWLIHLDLFARLINDKPAAFSSQLHDWRVNMPRLAAGSSQERNEAVPTVAFLVRSRLTFILINYFQESESLNNRSDILAAINPLCDDVEDIFEQWKIDEWLESCRDGDINGWILGELALSGYTSILFMLRKASSVPEMTDRRSMLSENDGMIPRSDLSMRTSRRILKLVHHMIYILKLPGPEAMSLILGNYRAYIAHAHLASGLMQEPTAPTTEDDLLLLRDVAKCIEGLAREVNEFVPLARAFMMVNDEVKRRVQGNHEAIERLVEAF